MRQHFPHSEIPSEAHLPSELRVTDELLAQMVAREPVPAGLNERIFRASVTALPARLRLHRATRHAAPAGPRRLQFHRPVWGQLAMAASIGIAFVVAVWFLAQPGVQPGSHLIAEHSAEPMIHAVAHRSTTLTPDAEWLLLETGGSAYSSHLVETRDLTYVELQRESQRFFDELEL